MNKPNNKPNVSKQPSELIATIIAKDDEQITLMDKDGIIYTFKTNIIDAPLGSSIDVKYQGNLNKNTELQTSQVISYTNVNDLDKTWQETDLFAEYYEKANNLLQKMTIDEKIGQLFLVRYNEEQSPSILNNYMPAGFVFFAQDFANKTIDQVKQMIDAAQSHAKIPLLTAVDEEGGKVVRISSNKELVPTPFQSSSELYNTGGWDLIRQDTIYKSSILKNLGLNVNLAPVVDVVTNPEAYMYERSFKQDVSNTTKYAKLVIEASKNTGVSYTLKHFPGYGNNSDTHVGQSLDTRTLNDLEKNDFLPFTAGIQSGAEAVLVSHNVVKSIDANNLASLSRSIHNILRNQLHFTGVIITDDLSMAATSEITNKNVLALLAGNDLMITTDYEESINAIKQALQEQKISEVSINRAALQVLAWKYYKGILTT